MESRSRSDGNGNDGWSGGTFAWLQDQFDEAIVAFHRFALVVSLSTAPDC
jgi:hypothetical protein